MFKHALKFISTYVIPALCVLYINFPNLRSLIIQHMIPISFIGITDTFFQERTIVEKLGVILGHMIFYPIMLNYKPNNVTPLLSVQLITLLAAISIIATLPTWKYKISRAQVIAMYVTIYLVL